MYKRQTLTNVNNIIQGTGTIGYNGLAVVNGAAGIINANSLGSALYLNVSAFTNQGLLEATNGGILQLVGGATFDNSGAHITSNGSGSMVEFLSSPTIQGGTLTTVSGEMCIRDRQQHNNHGYGKYLQLRADLYHRR